MMFIAHRKEPDQSVDVLNTVGFKLTFRWPVIRNCRGLIAISFTTDRIVFQQNLSIDLEFVIIASSARRWPFAIWTAVVAIASVSDSSAFGTYVEAKSATCHIWMSANARMLWMTVR